MPATPFGPRHRFIGTLISRTSFLSDADTLVHPYFSAHLLLILAFFRRRVVATFAPRPINLTPPARPYTKGIPRSMSANTSSAANIMSSSTSASVKTTKTTTKKVAASTASPAASNVAPAVSAPASVVEAAAPKVSKKAAAPAASVVAPVTASVASASASASTSTAVPAVAEVVAVSEDDIGAQLTFHINSLHEQLAAQKTALTATAASLKVVEKIAARLIKKAGRKGKGKAKPVDGAPPKPCVFTTPTAVSAELSAFLGLPKGSLIARSAVTKGIMAYAKGNSLMNKQTINTDAPLRKLLGLTETDNLTILNLQTHLTKHYIKNTPVAA